MNACNASYAGCKEAAWKLAQEDYATERVSAAVHPFFMINVTANQKFFEMTKRILLVATSYSDKLGDTGPTGSWVEEVASPYFIWRNKVG